MKTIDTYAITITADLPTFPILYVVIVLACIAAATALARRI